MVVNNMISTAANHSKQDSSDSVEDRIQLIIKRYLKDRRCKSF